MLVDFQHPYLDENGDLTQVVWSPGFDLEQWYWDNYSGGNSPGFYTTDQVSGDHRFSCFVEGTPISTPSCDVRAEKLRVGDLVHTVDHGLQPVLWKTDRRSHGIGKSAPIRISAGTFGAKRAVTVSPDHRLLFAGYEASLLFGSDCVYASAKSLVGLRGIKRFNRPGVRYIHFLLPVHAAVISHGLHSESLLAGDVAFGQLGMEFQKAYERVRPELGEQQAAYPCLKTYEGQTLAKVVDRNRREDMVQADLSMGSVIAAYD